MAKALVVGQDSEIGKLIGTHLRELGWSVVGTTRRKDTIGSTSLFLDARNIDSINKVVRDYYDRFGDWDLLIIAIGLLNPIGKLSEVDFEKWTESLNVNFVHQLSLINQMVNNAPKSNFSNRKVLTFAGSGTNSAPPNFSAYTLSKIALIKATEILAVEYPETTFLSVGTGWMKSPIHEQTLAAKGRAGDAYVETKRRIAANDFGQPNLLSDFINWYINCHEQSISGRNIALQGDDWKAEKFLDSLTLNNDSFKLRRVK